MSEPIRLAFILPHLRPGGAERVVVNYLRALDRSRFAPHLFLAREEGAFLDLVPSDVACVGLGGTRARRLPRRIAAALEEHRIDAAYSATDAVNLALLASHWWGGSEVRRIISVHTTPAHRLAEAKRPWVRKLLMRALYPRAALIAVPAAAIGSDLAGLLGSRRLPLITLPNPVIDSQQNARAGGGAPPRIVAAGRLVHAKGFDLLLDAAALLRRRGVQFELVIHGDGPLHKELLETATSLQLGNSVSFAGHEPDAASLYAAADLCVVPSRREGFGNVIIEAMAAGVPVLAAACPGPIGLIEDGGNGFLVGPENSVALADAIAALLTDPHRRRSVIEAGRRTAACFEIHSATRRLEDAVEGLIGNRRPNNHPDPGQANR